MKIAVHKFVPALIAVVACPAMAFGTVGSVSLNYSPFNSNVASPGSSVTLSLSLVVSGFSGADAVGGMDFLLTSQNSSSGAFFIQSRVTNTIGGFSDPQTPDDMAAARPGSNLNPTNDNDLGQSVANLANAVQNGTFQLATYVIGVDAGVAPGTYNFTTTTNIWTDQTGGEHSDLGAGTFSLTVVPEPATWSLLGLSVLAIAGLKLGRKHRQIS